MTTELRVTVNARVDKDNNFSFQFAHLVDTEAEAEDVGEQDAKLLTAYIAGYARGATA